MLSTSILPWLRDRRILALIAAAALAVSLSFAMIGNSWTANAAPADQSGAAVAEETIAGPSWTLSVRSVGGHVIEVATIEGSTSLDRG